MLELLKKRQNNRDLHLGTGHRGPENSRKRPPLSSPLRVPNRLPAAQTGRSSLVLCQQYPIISNYVNRRSALRQTPLPGEVVTNISSILG